MSIILISIFTMGLLAMFFAVVLVVANQKLKVREDPRVEEIMNALPGLNCGGCGFPGCHGLAEKIAEHGSLEGLGCPPGGQAVADKIAAILGIETSASVKKRAEVFCAGTRANAADKAEYRGIKTCAAARMVDCGPKACNYGCLGFGDCAKACPFDAIHVAESGVAVVDIEKCTGCGICVKNCPTRIIALIPCDQDVIVKCSSKDKGAVSRKNCKVACIACKLCEKNSPDGAFVVTGNLASVADYKKCQQGAANTAIEKCPTKCIVKLN
ncbi:MAG: RnfABCDGE type electron transport complex subunit B [Candidatus Margulisbacteria bacterium]|nr:RnfABCDGE type electron transport complex subunit B [Candidatus Margulisiibacteriota bacterium]